MGVAGKLRAGSIAAAGVTAAALALGGCGQTSQLSTPQLRAQVTPICALADQRLDRIPAPASSARGMRFLSLGIAALAPEVRALRALDGSATYREAVDATAAQLAALRFTLKGLKAGNDPVVAIKTLEARLAPQEAAADRDWQALGIRACIETS